MTTDGIVLAGYLDEEVAADDTTGTRARSRLIVSPTDELVDDMVLPCNVADPELARAVLYELQPGDQIRVAGHLGLPRAGGHPMCLHITSLALIAAVPLRLVDDSHQVSPPGDASDTTRKIAPSTLSGHGRLERYGPYVVWSDPDIAADTVWTEAGYLLGTAVYPETATHLIDTHQRRAYGDA